MIFRLLRRSAAPPGFVGVNDVAEIDDGNRTVTYADGAVRYWESMSDCKQDILEAWCCGASARAAGLVLIPGGDDVEDVKDVDAGTEPE